MTAVSEDASTDLKRRIAELERRLETALIERDAAIDRQTASALVNFRLQSEARAAIERQNAAAEILRTIASAPGDAPRVLQQIAETCARLFGAPSVSLQLAENGEWTQAYRFGDSSTRVRAAVPLDTIRVGGPNLPGTVISENRQIHLPDLDHLDPAFAHWPGPPHARAAGARTMCGTPLRREDKAIGVLILYRDRLAPFTEDELALLQSFADQGAIAIENARLFNESQEALARQTATSDMLRVISRSPTDVQPVFDAIVLTAARLLGCDRCTILRTEGATFSAVAAANRDGPIEALSPPNQPIDPAANFPSQAIVGKTMLHVPDWATIELPEHERVIRDMLNINSALYLPLLRGDDCIGLLVLVAGRPNRFGPAEIELAESFRDQALIAIENARLFNETQEALERQTATAEILKVIASSPSDVQPVFEAIVNSAARLFEPCTARITILRDGMLHWQAANAGAALQPNVDLERARSQYPLPFDPDRAPSARAILERRIVEIRDVTAPETPEFTRRAAAAGGFRSIAFVPLVNRDEGIGTIIITHAQPGFRLSEKQLSLAQTFADQAVIAIENARLFNETQAALERQTATADILKVIASSPSDVQPVFDEIAHSAKRLLDGFAAAVFRLVDSTVHLAAFTPTHPAADAALQADFPMPVDAFVPFHMVQPHEPLPIADIEELPPSAMKDTARLHGFRSMLYVPLMNGSVPIGLIAVTRAEPGAFAPNHVQLLQTFADQAVIAIENARLFNETREALERQTATSDILKVIASSPSDVQPVFEAIAHSAKRLLGGFSSTVFRFIDGMAHLKAFTPTTPEADQVLTANFPQPVAVVAPFQMTDAGEVVQIPDTEAETYQLRDVARARGYRSMLFVPLTNKGASIGFIAVTRTQTGNFADHHVQLLKTFADQAVIAIENTRLFNEVQQALERQTATADVLKVIASSPSVAQPVFDAIADRSKRLIGGHSTAVFRFIDDMAELVAFTPVNAEADTVLQKAFPAPLELHPMFRLAQGGSTVQIRNTESEEGGAEGVRDIARARGFRSLILVPLLGEKGPIGLISGTRPEPSVFSEHIVEMLETFAAQAVIAIENTRLFNEVQAKTADLEESLQQQTATSEVLEIISSSPNDLAPVFDKMLENATRVCGGEFGSMTLVKGDALRRAALYNAPPAYAALRTDAVLRLHPRSAIATAIRTRQVVQVEDIRNSPAYLERAQASVELAELGGARTIVVVPMQREDEVIGVITVYRQEVRLFGDKQIELLSNFARQAVIAIENARLLRELRQRTDDLTEALTYQTGSADILRVIASSPTDVTPVLKVIVESACEICEAYDAMVLLRDGDDLRVSAHHGPIPVRNAKHPIHRDWAAGRAFVDRKAVHVEDMRAENDEFPLGSQLAAQTGHRSVVCVPLFREGESVGVIVLRRNEVHPFSDKQIALLQTFADQAVIAIGNVRLFDEVQARTRDLTEALTYQTGSSNILRVIASSPTDVEPVLQAIVESAGELCGADDALVLLREGDDLRFRAHHGPIANNVEKWPINRSWAAGLAVLDQKPVHLPDILADENDGFTDSRELSRNFDATSIRSVLSVPLLLEKESIGAITLRRSEPRPFEDKQISLLQTFADQAVIAIGNVRLFDEVQARTRELSESLQQQTATADVLKVISRSTFDLQTVLETLIESAVVLSGANRGSIFLRDGDVFPLKAASRATPEFLQYWAANPAQAGRGSATSRVIQSGKIEIIPDVLEDPEMQMPTTSLVRIRGTLGVPMLRDNKVEGVLVLTRPEPGPFSKSQIDLVQTFADQAVIAVENVRLFDEAQARTRELSESLQFQTASSEVLKVISRSPDDLQPVLDVIVDTSRELCNALTSVIFLLRDGKFHHAAESVDESFRRPDYINTLRGNPISPDQAGSALARAAREKRTINIPNSAEDPEAGLGGPMDLGGAKALLSVPLILDGSVIGGITLRQSHLAPFTPRQIEAIESFADQAVIAISNVNLFEQVQQRTRELSKSLDDLRAAQDRLIQTEKLASLGQLTAGIAHEIKNPLNFVNNFAALSAELTDELNDALKPAVLDETIRSEVNEITGLLKDNLGKVVQHGKRADSIVRNMLLHSREGSGEHRPTDVNGLVDESLNLAYHGARAEKPQFNVTLQRDFDPEAGAIEAFPQEITRVLLNLVTNGFYAVNKRKENQRTEQRTDQKIDQGEVPFEPVVSATTKGRTDHVEIRIRDNGTGIPPDVKEKMFNPFFTTKPAGEGTGLGLSMSHDIIVKQHGGTIDVDTVPGEFTEFTIVLPRTSSLLKTRS